MKIGKYKIKDELINNYITHLNLDNKQPIQEWENKRKELHDKIFESLKLDRHTKEGMDFDRLLTKYTECEITDTTIRLAKRISACNSQEELDLEQARINFIRKWSKK